MEVVFERVRRRAVVGRRAAYASDGRGTAGDGRGTAGGVRATTMRAPPPHLYHLAMRLSDRCWRERTP